MDVAEIKRPCRHCSARVASRPYGLCFGCYADADLTAKYSGTERPKAVAAPCRHCKERPGTRSRGLCFRCFASPAIRDQYPPARTRHRPVAVGPEMFAEELARVRLARVGADSEAALAVCRELSAADAVETLRLLTAARRMLKAGKLQGAVNIMVNTADREAATKEKVAW